MIVVRDSLAEATGVTGEFIRVASNFRETVSANHSIYKPEFQRYHLYISLACPWANRCSAALTVKGTVALFHANNKFSIADISS